MIPWHVDVDAIAANLTDSDIYLHYGMDAKLVSSKLASRLSSEDATALPGLAVSRDILALDVPESAGVVKVLYFPDFYPIEDLRDIAQAVLDRTDASTVIARVWAQGIAVSDNVSRLELEAAGGVLGQSMSIESTNEYVAHISEPAPGITLVNAGVFSGVLVACVAALAFARKLIQA